MNDQNDDDDLFRSLYGDIERVKHDRVAPWRRKPKVKARRDDAHQDEPEVGLSPWPELPENDPEHVSSSAYQAEGIQHKVMRKLRRGQIRIETGIDLHGMTRVMALQELQEFIASSRSRGISCIQVIHGKGTLSAGGKAVLKPSVAAWLRQMPEVLAYCPCLPGDGGDGALYVLLKKR
jgi:DNA-nicking Smr family endonuclease